jgi:hypothetical protein
MPTPVPLTYKILWDKVQKHAIDDTWKEWALEMIEAGFESIDLYELAGILKPYNQFELQDLAHKVLSVLSLDYSDIDKVLNDYIYYFLFKNIDDITAYPKILRELRDIYYELDMDNRLLNFSLLYWAKEDLLYDEVQWYWHGANRDNIDRITHSEFAKWKQEYEVKYKL